MDRPICVILQKSEAGEIEKPTKGLSLGLVDLCPKCRSVLIGRLAVDEFGKPVVLFECPDIKKCAYVWGRHE